MKIVQESRVQDGMMNAFDRIGLMVFHTFFLVISLGMVHRQGSLLQLATVLSPSQSDKRVLSAFRVSTQKAVWVYKILKMGYRSNSWIRDDWCSWLVIPVDAQWCQSTVMLGSFNKGWGYVFEMYFLSGWKCPISAEENIIMSQLVSYGSWVWLSWIQRTSHFWFSSEPLVCFRLRGSWRPNHFGKVSTLPLRLVHARLRIQSITCNCLTCGWVPFDHYRIMLLHTLLLCFHTFVLNNSYFVLAVKCWKYRNLFSDFINLCRHI